MIRSLIYSLTFHSIIVLLTILSLPFMLREPIDLPPIVSVELIQISDKTNIPYAPKARKIIEEKKKEEERLVSEQAPPAAKAKEKPDRIPLPNEKKEEKQIVKKKQNPEEVKPEIRQSSEFEKKEIIDTNQIAALIDKAKEEQAVKEKTKQTAHKQGRRMDGRTAHRAQCCVRERKKNLFSTAEVRRHNKLSLRTAKSGFRTRSLETRPRVVRSCDMSSLGPCEKIRIFTHRLATSPARTPPRHLSSTRCTC